MAIKYYNREKLRTAYGLRFAARETLFDEDAAKVHDLLWDQASAILKKEFPDDWDIVSHMFRMALNGNLPIVRIETALAALDWRGEDEKPEAPDGAED